MYGSYFTYKIIDFETTKLAFPWVTGQLSPGVPGVPWHPQIWADQLTLFQTEGADYAHQITIGTTGFLDLPTALFTILLQKKWKIIEISDH